MIARLQSFVVVLLLLAWTACLIAAWHGSNGWWAVGPVIGLVAAHAAILAGELLLQHRTSQRLGDEPLRTLTIARAVLAEMGAAYRVMGWLQPFRSRRFPDSLTGAPQSTGVILVHGLLCNRGVWNAWMSEFRQRQVPFLAVNLEPAFGSIDDYLPIIDAAVRQMRTATGRPPVVVGHSMGGIAARAWAAVHASESPVLRIVTVGSPHGGTSLGHFVRFTNASQMASGSPWLEALAAAESSDRAKTFICFYSRYDNVIVPARSARLAGADNRLIDGRPHLDLLNAPEIRSAVIDLVSQTGRLRDAP